MRLGTVLKIVGLIVVVLVVAAVAWVLNLDPNDHKDRIAEMVEEETGRDIVFNGPIDLDIGTTTRLVVRDVTFSNAEWGSEPNMATLGLAEVEFRLFPLLGGELDIPRAVFRDANVLIETNAEGQSNLQFPRDEEDDVDVSDDDAMELSFGQVRIENIVLTEKDQATGRTLVATVERANAVPAQPGAPLDIDIQGDLRLDDNVTTIDLDGQVGTAEAILSGSEPVPVNLKGVILGYDIAIEGGVRQPDNPGGIDVDVSVSGDGLKTLQPFMTSELPALGPVAFTAHITGNPDHPIAEDIRLTALNMVVTGKADLGTEEQDPSYNLKVELNGQDLALVTPYVDLPLEELGPLTGSINIVGDLDTVRLEPNALTADNSRVTGSIKAGIDNEPPTVDYDITLTAEGQTLDIVEPFVGIDLPPLGPINGTIRAVGDRDQARIEITEFAAEKSVITGQVVATNLQATPNIEFDVALKADSQSLAILKPYLDGDIAGLGTINGGIQAAGTLENANITFDDLTLDKSKISGTARIDRAGGATAATYDLTIVASGQTLAIAKPFVDFPLPETGPISGTIRAVGDGQQARIELTNLATQNSVISGNVTASGLDKENPAIQFDVGLNAKSQSLEIIRPYVGADVANLGTIDGGLKATGSVDKAKVTFDNLRIDKTRISGQADIDQTGGTLKAIYDVTVSAEGQDLAIIEPFVGVDLPDQGPINLNVALKGDGTQATFENLDLSFQDSRLTGNGRVGLSGPEPDVEANIKADKFDLTRFFPDTTPATKPKEISREQAEQGSESSGGGSVFPTDPLPLEFLSVAQADITLNAGELITPYGTYRDVDVRAVLEDDSLNVRPLSATYGESRMSANLSVDARAGTPLVALSLSSPDVAIGQLLKDFADLDVLQGKGTVNISLSGSGRSVADILGSSNGHVRVLMGQGRMRNEGLGYVSGVFSSIGEVLGKKEWVVVDCLANDFEIQNGIADSKVGVLNTEVISLAIDGNIDLKQQRYDLKVTPSPRGLDLSLAVPVDVRGPLDSPSFSPNAIGSITKLGSLFGAIVFPPAALIGLTEMGGNSHPCVEYAKNKGENENATPTAPLEKGSGGGVLNAPGKVLEGILGR